MNITQVGKGQSLKDHQVSIEQDLPFPEKIFIPHKKTLSQHFERNLFAFFMLCFLMEPLRGFET